MANALSNLEPKKLWGYFEEICQHPHPSKKEDKLAAYLKGWAKEHSFEVKSDKIGNFVIKKPATPGMEDRKGIVIQGHIDMVCEKNSDVVFDFDNDPIQPYIDGEWVKAKGTTLGADNGIGVAMGMAVLDSTDIPHPQIELLCTIDEETGLTGAMQLGTDLLTGDILINLDSEEDGAFTIGCAGGQNTTGLYEYKAAPIPANHTPYKVVVKGLRGGHSGIEIHDGRANAAKIMTRALWTLTKEMNIVLSDFASGNKHNAIPREAFATILVPNDKEADFLKYAKDFYEILKPEWVSKEPNIEFSVEKTEMPKRVMTNEMQRLLLDSFYVIPHGPLRMSPDIKGLVQSSNNFAIVETHDNDIMVLTSQRSSVETEKINIVNKVRASMELGGAKVKSSDGYPAWQPNVHSPILQHAKETYKKLYGVEPKIEAIHAGLECGLIGEKYPNMDMLSFGPNLKEVHTPNEQLNIPTTKKCIEFLLEIIKTTPKK